MLGLVRSEFWSAAAVADFTLKPKRMDRINSDSFANNVFKNSISQSINRWGGGTRVQLGHPRLLQSKICKSTDFLRLRMKQDLLTSSYPHHRLIESKLFAKFIHLFCERFIQLLILPFGVAQKIIKKPIY